MDPPLLRPKEGSPVTPEPKKRINGCGLGSLFPSSNFFLPSPVALLTLTSSWSSTQLETPIFSGVLRRWHWRCPPRPGW
jgi:hypothetical protein